jgi:hypothetical protein
MKPSWLSRTQRLKKWCDKAPREIDSSKLRRIEEAFRECADQASKAIAVFDAQFVVFQPTSWPTEDDWLLTAEQWADL